MSDIPNAAPAGAGEQSDSAQSQPQRNGPIDINAAASMFAELGDAPDTQAEAAPGDETQPIEQSTEQSEEAPEAEASDATEDTGEESPAAEDAEEQPEAGTDEDEQLAHGNMRTRLRDGTVTTVGELKKLADEAREYRAKAPQIAAQERQIGERAAQLAQQEQFVQQVLPQAIAILQAYIPPPPDPALLATDVLAHYEQDQRHKAGLSQLQQLQEAYAAQHAQERKRATEAAETAYHERIAAGRAMLLEKMPELANPETVRTVYTEFLNTAKKFGFSEEEAAVDDPRVILLVHTLSSKAAAYDKLIAQKKAVVQPKVAKAAPVQRPSPRVSPEAQEQRVLDERVRRVRENGGNINDAIAVFATLEQE